MAYKVAIATTDGEKVNSHFGSAPQIIIYQAENSEWSVDGIVSFENGAGGCTGQHESAEERLLAVGECQYIIASRIGSHMQKYFEYQKQKYFEMPNADVDMILEKILQYQEKINQRKEV
jgi:nitrogen fixation protein NifX